MSLKHAKQGCLIDRSSSAAQLERIKYDKSLIKVFGHTHFAEIKTADDSLIINPGSASIPQNAGKLSVAVLELSENSPPRAEIIYFK